MIWLRGYWWALGAPSDTMRPRNPEVGTMAGSLVCGMRHRKGCVGNWSSFVQALWLWKR
ncbi:hypothetical protein ACRALDRAFT_2057838 [Sodiomyces alcalophilus JCM 7366]|uniref:uncharacterized protein n=1 Tax=Sodiomyces alcalophilus JCM 7366 TaxID=591952 RepID=UPI0039B6C9F1